QDRRRNLPDRDEGYYEGDREERRAEERHPPARLRRLGARTAGNRNPGQWLAALRCRSGPDLRRRYRGKIPARPAQDRDRSRHALERSRARVAELVSTLNTWHNVVPAKAGTHNHKCLLLSAMAIHRTLTIGSFKMRGCGVWVP